MSVTFVGVSGDAGVAVQRLGEQSFSVKKDTIEPYIYYPNAQGGIHELGAVVELSAAQITDVLTPYLEKNHRFYVIGPDDECLTSIDGVALDGTCDVTRAYKVKLDSLGSYLVQYVYEDQNGNPKTSHYALNVYDRTAPTIKLVDVSDGDVVKAKINTWVSVAEYSVSDDMTETKDILHDVVVYDPDYIRMTFEEGKFAALKKGDYLVCYYAYDDKGNYATVSYTVHVE